MLSFLGRKTEILIRHEEREERRLVLKEQVMQVLNILSFLTVEEKFNYSKTLN